MDGGMLELGLFILAIVCLLLAVFAAITFVVGVIFWSKIKNIIADKSKVKKSSGMEERHNEVIITT